MAADISNRSAAVRFQRKPRKRGKWGIDREVLILAMSGSLPILLYLPNAKRSLNKHVAERVKCEKINQGTTNFLVSIIISQTQAPKMSDRHEKEIRLETGRTDRKRGLESSQRQRMTRVGIVENKTPFLTKRWKDCTPISHRHHKY